MNDYEYIGNELDVFAHATNWKSYLRSRLGKFIRGDVLEVGAGIGGTTQFLCDGAQRSWLCLEPDRNLLARLEGLAESGSFAMKPEILAGSIGDLSPGRLFDCILYVDVLEHVEDDRSELARAARHVAPGGKLVVVAPAHNFLYSQFDRAIGHFRRYNKSLLRAARPEALRFDELYYLDAFGMILSLGNRILLRSGSPTLKQIKIWDRFFVVCSRGIDPLLGRTVGKTIVAVLAREESGSFASR